jgi:glycerol uptake facilitator-like aquaporin
MATKKAASSAKKNASKQTSTKVTTVKAVESSPMSSPKSSTSPSTKFSLRNTSLVTASIAEFVGTFIFAATVVAGQGQPILVFFALTGVVLAIAALSGGYVNPALTLAGWATKRLNGVRALCYVVAQFLGAMLAIALLDMFVKASPAAGSATDLYSAAPNLFAAAAIPEGKEWLIFFAELVGATIFGFAVANATREKNDRTAAAFTVGIGVFLGLMVAGSAAAFLGGTAILNPAVAVSLQALNFETVWPITVYVIGAGIGAVVGFVLYDLLRKAEKNA